MAKEPTSTGSEPLVRSATSQAPAEGHDRSGLAAYLERMTATAELQQVASRSLAALDLEPNQRVLEVGCGTGVFLPLLANAVGPTGAVVGIDHAPDFVEQARQRVVNLGLDNTVTVDPGYGDRRTTIRQRLHLVVTPDEPVPRLVRRELPGRGLTGWSRPEGMTPTRRSAPQSPRLPSSLGSIGLTLGWAGCPGIIHA